MVNIVVHTVEKANSLVTSVAELPVLQLDYVCAVCHEHQVGESRIAPPEGICEVCAIEAEPEHWCPSCGRHVSVCAGHGTQATNPAREAPTRFPAIF